MIELREKNEFRCSDFGKKCQSMQVLKSLGIRSPRTFIVDCKDLKEDDLSKMVKKITDSLGEKNLLTLRPTSQDLFFNDLPTFLYVGIGNNLKDLYVRKAGELNYLVGYCCLIKSISVNILGADPDIFDDFLYGKNYSLDDELSSKKIEVYNILLSEYKIAYKRISGTDFPQTLTEQLNILLPFFANKSNRKADIADKAQSAPKMGLMVQQLENSSSKNYYFGRVNFIDRQSGKQSMFGVVQRSFSDSILQDRLKLKSLRISDNFVKCEGDINLNFLPTNCIDWLWSVNETLTRELKDTFEVDFTLNGGELTVLDFRVTKKSVKTLVQLAVDMALRGYITKEEALLRVDPLALTEYLHPRIEEINEINIICKGVPASPGAATGRIVFNSNLAAELTSNGENVILVMTETGPEDIKGMQISKGILTVRGGLTSHAALIARGLGIPGVVGAIDLRVNSAERKLYLKSGDKFAEGEEITIDGSSGNIIKGRCDTKAPELTGAFSDLLSWADEYRSLKVRANADTPQDASLARKFNVDGIGLCRTEHMFFKKERLFLMQEMIFSESSDKRLVSLEKLMPIQRKDFIQLFEVMSGQPVAIRLLDPPLHEFLPKNEEELNILAGRIGVEFEYIVRRSRELKEFNPMLGHRGVRLGITMPEIYQMQVRAIFEATSHVLKAGTGLVIPEIMFPLVSANKEVVLLRKIIDKIAEDVYACNGVEFSYKIGAMIETPRAALRAGEIAEVTDFISFGTNDLTQMTYGLSRDDAGKFLNDYINEGVFDEDPFLSLDQIGVGELISLASSRGKGSNKNLSIALCGEHGGDPKSIQYCKELGLDYVSCSPYRVPIARLAAAQADIKSCS